MFIEEDNKALVKRAYEDLNQKGLAAYYELIPLTTSYT